MTIPLARVPSVTPRWRSLLFAVFTLVAAFLFRAPLAALLQFSIDNRWQTHMLFIPLISLYLVGSERKSIFARVATGSPYGLMLLGAGLVLRAFGPELLPNLTEESRLSLAILSLVVFYTGGFVFFFGAHAARAATFPLAFLVYMIPIPELLLETLIFWNQSGTSTFSDLLFRLLGVPAIRDGHVFILKQDFAIEIAGACSGVRSFIVLVIVATLAGHFALRRTWTRVLLIVATIPIAVLKNALRVVVLSVASAYVESSLMDSALHSSGGSLFFVVALVGLALSVSVLRRAEVRPGRQDRDDHHP